MKRAFAPFVEASIATRTRILLERPEGGDVTKMIGRAVDFSVWVEGRVPATSSPEALRLLYRYNPSDPYQIARFYESRFKDDARRLGLKVILDGDKNPALNPRATDNVRGSAKRILSANVLGPWKTVWQLEYGYALRSDVKPVEGDQEVLLIILKLF